MSHSSNPSTNGPWPIQRRWVRVPINVRVRLRYEREGTQQQCHCRSLDISEGGMGLISPYEVELDQVVDLEFTLPETTAPLTLRATIRSQAGFRLGCEFILPTDRQKTEIARYGRAFQSSKSS
jgi:c-di-GMP-binding flagellar brake protein YcgR